MRQDSMSGNSFLQAGSAAPLKVVIANSIRAVCIAFPHCSAWRKLLPHLTCLLLTAAHASAQHIETRVLTPAAPMRITISPNVATTLLFPEAIGGAFGLGLVGAGGHENQTSAQGSVALEHPEGSPLMVLHALMPGAKVVMTVLLDGKLYVFDVSAGPDPDFAITYVLTDPQVRRGQEVTEEEVRADRLKYDPELLVGYLRRATDAELMRKSSPELYSDYSVRQVNYTSESDWAITTVQTIHRFEKSDIIVLQGTVQNKLGKPLIFDGRSTTVQVVQEVHPDRLTDVMQPIPAGQTVPISVVLQGDWDGSRAHLSIQNEFRIILPAPISETPTRYQSQETGRGYAPKFRVGRPGDEGKGVIPRTQTGP
jgi:hypothetical protein